MGEKQTYRVKPGYRFGMLNELGEGDTVELTPQEAEGFKDKLVLVVVETPAPIADPATPSAEGAKGKPKKTE